jgi:sucrose-6-phosphate hydrolase SacC (GH32 family)
MPVCSIATSASALDCQVLAGDADLRNWEKVDTPFLALPPPDLPLTGWRDPFVIQRGGRGKPWIILMGAGLKDQGGTTLIYRSQGNALSTPWEYDGLLCIGDPSQGAMWECPLLWRISAAPNPGNAPLGSPRRDTLDRVTQDELLRATSSLIPSACAAAAALAIMNGTDIFAESAHELQVRLPPSPVDGM